MSFDFQPTLEGPTLTMRPLNSSDWEALYGVASDPLIWELHPLNDRWQEPVFRKFFDEAMDSGGALVAINRASGKIVGSSRYSTDFAAEGEVEIGWTFLARSHWGGNTNREMKHIMLAHAFGHYPKVIFRIGEHNLRSRRACEKIGGQLLRRSQILKIGDRNLTHVVYAIDRQGFSGLL